MNVRSEIATIMSDCFVHLHDGTAIPDSFINGGANIALDALSIDSLAAVQICVELENRLEWSISPKQFLAFETLGDVASALEAFVNER